MINYQGNGGDETTIVDNKIFQKRNFQSFNTISTVVEAA